MEFFKPFLAFVCIENDVCTPQDTSGHLKTPHDPSGLHTQDSSEPLRTTQDQFKVYKMTQNCSGELRITFRTC